MGGDGSAESGVTLTNEERGQRCQREPISHEHYTREAVEQIVTARLADAQAAIAERIEWWQHMHEARGIIRSTEKALIYKRAASIVRLYDGTSTPPTAPTQDTP